MGEWRGGWPEGRIVGEDAGKGRRDDERIGRESDKKIGVWKGKR